MILYDGQHVDGSPFTVKVYDPGQVRVSGLSSGVVGAAVHFASKHITTLSTLTVALSFINVTGGYEVTYSGHAYNCPQCCGKRHFNEHNMPFGKYSIR